MKEICDLVICWSADVAADPRPNPCGKIYWASPEQLQLWFYLRDMQGDKHFFSVNLSGTPQPYMDENKRPIDGKIEWGMIQLGATVWKLVPSIVCPDLHAFVTVINVPSPIPWKK